MFKSFILINASHPKPTSLLSIWYNLLTCQYVIQFLAFLGAYKIYKWSRFILVNIVSVICNFCSSRIRGKNSKKQFNQSLSFITQRNKKLKEEFLFNEKTSSQRKKLDKRKEKLKEKLTETLAQSDSLIGVATAAATAATIFVNHRRNKCCEICCFCTSSK